MPDDPRVEVKPMFGNVGAFVNGNGFTGRVDEMAAPLVGAVLARRPPRRGRSRAMLRPLLQAVGHLPGIIRSGGHKIERDVGHAAAPLAILARASTYLRPPRLDNRGSAAAACLALVGILTALIWAGSTRPRQARPCWTC